MSGRAGQRGLRVGLNLVWHGGRGAGGVGRYALALPGALLEVDPRIELTAFVAARTPPEIRDTPWADAARMVRIPVVPGSAQAQIAEQLALPALAAAHGLDVLHSPANTGPILTPRTATVVSLMDLIWLHFADQWNPDPRAQRSMRRWVALSVRHADQVFAITSTAGEELIRDLGVARDRVTVTPLGVHADGLTSDGPTLAPERALRERLGLGERRVILCVSQKRPYKNLGRVVAALPALPDDVVLVIPGSPTPYEQDLRTLAQALAVGDRLILPDWVSEAELQTLYGLARAFVLPTLTEGFGLPVLEAMRHGLPVACSGIPVLREVAGDAALFFDPNDQAGCDEALRRLLSDAPLRRRLRGRGRERVTHFTWRATAQASLEGYARALTAHRGRT